MTHAVPSTEATMGLQDTPQGIDAAAFVAGCYVAVVQIRGERVEPRYRRRTYWNLPSAQRAIDRARMDGLTAELVLCQLVPVGAK